MRNAAEAPRTVAIIGGGFSGAAVAYHLARGGADAAVTVYEPRQNLGAGLAYDTDEPVHRINVPATRMSLEPDDPDHFARWLVADAEGMADPETCLADGRMFPGRNIFGRYVTEHVRPYLAAGAIGHVRSRITSVERMGGRWRLVTADGAVAWADIVVIATSHPPPVPPGALAPVRDDPRLIADPLVPGALDAVVRDARVLIVGTGLTMADSVAALDRRGHRGPITAVSRRGQRSKGHGVAPPEGIGDFATAPSGTALELLRRVRAELREAAAQGHTWHGVFDKLRRQGGPIWSALPAVERRRLVRHLRPYWDTHRFRIAPQVEAVLERRASAGTLTVFAASPVGATALASGLRIDLMRRRGGTQTHEFDAVVVTTGPGHGSLLATQPHLASLAAAGLLRSDAMLLGLDCDRLGRAVGSNGAAVANLFVAGPLARGTLGELMGLPEVSAFARVVASAVAARMSAGAGQAQRPLRAAAARSR